MTVFELCGENSDTLFTIGKSKIEWESAVYSDKSDKVRISRVINSDKGKPFIIGLRYQQRYISPDTIIFLTSKNK